jgi:hypothetical protein
MGLVCVKQSSIPTRERIRSDRVIKIEIADICVGLKVNDSEITQQILGRYADFLSPDGTPEVTVQVEVREGVQFVPLEPGLYVINSSFQDGRLTFESYFEAGFVDMASGQGHLLIAPCGSIENFLRVLYSWRCIYKDALLVHSAGVIKDGKAFVFFGPSRSGKTTVACLSLDHMVLSDDLVIIKKDDTYKAYGVPFQGDMPETPRTNAQANLYGLFCLKKDASHFIRPLGHSQAVAELISCVPFVIKDLALSQRAMDICTNLIASVPVKELHFRRDKGFWKVIDETG